MAVVAIVALALTAAFPSGSVPPGGHLPLSWMWSWVKQSPAWAGDALFGAPEPAAPMRDDGHYVSAGETRANTGNGRAPGRVAGALPPDTTRTTAKKDPSTAPDQKSHFDVKTSRRVAAMSTATSDTYLNADGSYTRKLSSSRLNFLAKDGFWQPIDTTLASRSDGRLHMAADSVDVSFGRQGTATRAQGSSLASLTMPTGETLAYGLQGAAPVAAAVSGSTAVYHDILPNTDLEFTTSPSALKETVILKSPKAGNVWLFPLTLDGLTARSAKDGSVELVGASGAVVATIPVGYMSDSHFDAESGTMTASSAVVMDLTEFNGAPALRVTADRAWLADPARVYPVQIDPTASFYVDDDVSVDNDSGTGPAQQNGVDLTVGTYDNGTHIARSFINIDSFGARLPGHLISSATLHGYVSWTYDCNNPRTVEVWRVTSPWTVSGLASSGLWGPTAGHRIGWNWPASNYPACTNTSANRSVGSWLDIGMYPEDFNDMTVNPGSNMGLALIAHTESGNDEYGIQSKYGWKRFTSRNYGDGTLGPWVSFDYTDAIPQVTAQYPPGGYAATTLTPELIATATDADNYPHPLTYIFQVFDPTQRLIATSGATAAASWKVPAGILTWGSNYWWTVTANDGGHDSSSQSMNALSTPPPQPLVTSRLAQNGGHGFAPGAGNYTTAVTDATVATAGPPLTIQRAYNSRDPRVGNAFGAGWSTQFDASATEVLDAAGALQAVVITAATGEDVAFGRNGDGTFSPPLGKFATLAPVSGGGYKMVTKDGTTFLFAGASGVGRYRLASTTDAQGRTSTLTLTGGLPTLLTSASGRALHINWTTPPGATRPHVYTVVTDPATVGVPSSTSTWTYSYTGDLLTKVCPPTSTTACSTYAYGDGTQYPATVLNAGPRSYWRLGEASGPTAVSSVIDNAGVDNATYANVILGQPGPLPAPTNLSATAAAFNGINSAVTLPKTLLTSASYLSVSMWFKTTATGGILLAEGNQPLNSATAPSAAVTPLFVGTDGKLHGGWYTPSGANQLVSPQPVNNGVWHHAVLTGAGNQQMLYLDGAAVTATPLAGQVGHLDMSYVSVGAGYSSAGWPAQPAAGWRYFTGSIAEVSVFDRGVTAADVASMYSAGTTVAHPLTQVKRPTGNTNATMVYNGATGALTQVTDSNNGVWQLPDPTVTGSYQVHASTVLGAGPADYWRLAETGATQAINQVSGAVATYSGVTLGTIGGPFDDPDPVTIDPTVASFNGTSSMLQLPAADVPNTSARSVAMWFKLAAGGSGILFGYQTSQLPSGSSGYVPILYVGPDGKLRGTLWTATGAQIVSTGSVADGQWHHVALAASPTSQTMYLDGANLGTINAALVNFGAGYAQIGAGQWTGWAGAGPGNLGYWPGQIAEVSYYRSQLSAAQVGAQFAARAKATAGGLVRTVTVIDPGTQPSKTVFEVATGRKVAEIDALGNTTQYGYDVGGYLYRVTDPNGNVTTTEQDARGNTVSTITCQVYATQVCSTSYNSYFLDSSTITNPKNDLR